MEKPNKERFLIKIIKELSADMDFEVDFLCYNWLICIRKSEIVKHILGYDWELNSSTSQLIAKDKSACYETLILHKVPSIEHKLYLSPQFQNYIGENGSWKSLIKYAENHNYKIVCKSNTGTGGNEVFKITNQLELETSVHKLFLKYRAICLCPFYDISTEYRVIVLNNSVQLIYAKERPYIVGNGKSTVLELIMKTYDYTTVSDFDLPEINSFDVLGNGVILEVGWKHNLGKGAKPSPITNSELRDKLTEVAMSAIKAINIKFASVDIVECNKQLLVMEINSGIMMEYFAQENIENYNLAKDIYRKAMIEMLK